MKKKKITCIAVLIALFIKSVIFMFEKSIKIKYYYFIYFEWRNVTKGNQFNIKTECPTKFLFEACYHYYKHDIGSY